MPESRCKDCVFFVDFSDEDGSGSCHRYPSDPRFGWAPAQVFEWCGEFEPAPEGAESSLDSADLEKLVEKGGSDFETRLAKDLLAARELLSGVSLMTGPGCLELSKEEKNDRFRMINRSVIAYFTAEDQEDGKREAAAE